eukprot:4409449-Amphidinium_carterae.1
MPGLVTILCHAECLGAWTFFWAPCRGTWPFEEVFKANYTTAEGKECPFIGLLASRSEICGWRWPVNVRKCTEATLEHLVWLLYSKFAHNTFTIAAFRIVKAVLVGNGMTLQASFVLLKFSWLVVMLFGPCLPILNALIALLANIYSILLFDTAGTQFLHVKDDHGASLPAYGSSTVALLALALQLSNLL